MNEFNSSSTSARTISGWTKFTRPIAYLCAIIAIGGILALILASPFLLRILAQNRGTDWARLSNIGQTYGAASAILSGFALIGISLSLYIQARQVKVEQVRITRDRHIELLRIILEAPEIYGEVIGMRVYNSRIDDRQFLFCTMWVNYARQGFELGVLSEGLLRSDILGPAFRNAPMREWWTSVRKFWSVELLGSSRERRFVQIIEEEYRKEVATGPPADLNLKDRPRDAWPVSTPKHKHTGVAVGAALGTAIGILLGSRLRHGHR